MSNKIFTFPNLITVTRIVGAIWVILNFQHYPWLSFFIFGIVTMTDFADGYLARWIDKNFQDSKRGSTTLGQMLDPIADKILIAITLFLNLELATVLLSIEIIIIPSLQIFIVLETNQGVVTEFSKKITIIQSILLILLLFPLLSVETYLAIYINLIALSVLRTLSYYFYFQNTKLPNRIIPFWRYILTKEPK